MTRSGSSSRKVAVAALLVALALLLWFLWPRAAAGPARDAPVRAAKGAPRQAPLVGGADALTPLTEEAMNAMNKPPSAVMGRPILTGVTIEPQPACLDQPVVVKMRGADPDGLDNQIIYEVWGSHGNPSTWVPKLAGTVPVLVAAYNLRGDYDQRTIDLEVRDCGHADEPLHVVVLDAGQTGVVGLQALLPPRFEGTSGWRYTWDFGDAQTAETDVPYAEHDYRKRTQIAYLSTYLVRVTARRTDSEVSGMVSVPFLNLYALNRVIKGMVVPEIQLDKVELTGRRLTAHVTVRHWEDAPITVKDVSIRVASCATSRSDLVGASDARMSTMTFPPGESQVVMTMTVPEGTCSVLAELTGVYKDGSHILLEFGAGVPGTRPDALPTATPAVTWSGDTPEGTAMMARFEAARVLLGLKLGDPIPDVDIARLDREGKLPPMPPPPGPVTR